jgi:RNase P subunit RPR2
MATNSQQPIPTSTWTRKRHDGRPIVGYTCTGCGHEIELFDSGPRVVEECPTCPAMTVRYTREACVQAAHDQLRAQLAALYDIALPDEPHWCSVCGTTADLALDPGPDATDLAWRCPTHQRLDDPFWCIPGDWPTVPAADNRIYQCEDCGAEYTLPFGIRGFTAENGRYDGTETRLCFACLEPDWQARFPTVQPK